MAKTFKVEIDRYQDEATSASYVQTYKLKHYPSQTVLEVLVEIQNGLAGIMFQFIRRHPMCKRIN